jgi:ribosomal protein L24
MVLVKGVNLKLKRLASTQDGEASGIKQINKPVHISNVSLIDPEKGIPTKVRGDLYSQR